MLRACLALLLVAGCARDPDPVDPGDDDDSELPDTAPPDTAVSTPTLEDHLRAAGFGVSAGLFAYSNLDGCCDPGANCWGNNPSTPYGIPSLPPSPGQPFEDHDLLVNLGSLPASGTSRTFRLRRDEAMVVVGRLPPRAKYLSYRTYVGERFGQNIPVIGSLGPSLNNLVIAETMGTDDIWGEPFAFVTTMDADIERRVHDALLAAGLAPHQIHDDRIPPAVVRPGAHVDSDTFFALMRVAVYDDPDAGAAHQASPDYTVLRLTPQGYTPLTDPHPWPTFPARGTGVTEEPWREARDALEAAIEAAWPDHDAVVAQTEPYWIDTVACVGSGENCTGDIRDRFVALLPAMMLPDDETFAVIYGVNHERTGKASYSSASVQTVIRQTGLESLTSVDMPGTAAHFLPDHPQRDDLYAVVVARDCSGHAARCIEVPSVCPGPTYDEPVKITIRAYLEPATATAPLPTEMLGDRVMRFTPRAD